MYWTYVKRLLGIRDNYRLSNIENSGTGVNLVHLKDLARPDISFLITVWNDKNIVQFLYKTKSFYLISTSSNHNNSKFGTWLYFIPILTWGLGFYGIKPVEDLRHSSPSVRPV